MIEDILAQKGVAPDIDDETLGAAYERCPAAQRSILKNAVAFAYALAQTGAEPVTATRRFSHVEQTVTSKRLGWAFFAVDQRCFPVTAILSAVVLALVAKVETVFVHVTGPLTDPLLCGFDLLSVDQIYTTDHRVLLEGLAAAGPGVAVDLAGLDLDFPRLVRPDPANYGVAVALPPSEHQRAYRAVTAVTTGQPRAFVAYGGEPGSAPVVMDERFLGCWVWDVITPETFRFTTSFYA
ncbi:MAG: hypothetical protein GXY42_12170 [Desulfovibrionales bacterium]|nr:hypothetical protein [Desulfovibrionales bacterium]